MCFNAFSVNSFSYLHTFTKYKLMLPNPDSFFSSVIRRRQTHCRLATLRTERVDGFFSPLLHSLFERVGAPSSLWGLQVTPPRSPRATSHSPGASWLHLFYQLWPELLCISSTKRFPFHPSALGCFFVIITIFLQDSCLERKGWGTF